MNRDDLRNYKYNQIWIEKRLWYIEEYRESIQKITSTLSYVPRR